MKDLSKYPSEDAKGGDGERERGSEKGLEKSHDYEIDIEIDNRSEYYHQISNKDEKGDSSRNSVDRKEGIQSSASSPDSNKVSSLNRNSNSGINRGVGTKFSFVRFRSYISFRDILRSPLVLLMLLSPLIGELLSGSSPPLEFFNPVTFILLLGLYGTGVVLIREICVKWDKGWASIIVLGIVYALIEEGLSVKSFFDPNWVDLGILGVYGRWMGVNWVWTVCLTIFHTVYSISLPIILFGLLFPGLKKKRLLSDRGLKIFFTVFFLDNLLIYLVLTDYLPNILAHVLNIVLVLGLVLIALRIPRIYPWSNTPLASPKIFFVSGALFGFLFFIFMYFLPNVIPYPIFPIMLEIILGLVLLRFVAVNLGFYGNHEHKLALVSGILSPLIFLSFVHELNGVRGMSLVGIAFVIFLLIVKKRIWSVEI